MLRISIVDTRSQRRLVVEGKLVPPWTTELRTAYDNANTDLGSRELVVDLKNLTVISHEGEDLLAELMNQGAQFRCCGMFARLLLRQLSNRARAMKKDGT
jgi:hypothetical protein